MKEMIQAGNFYDSLSPEEQKDLTERRVLTLLAKADPRLASGVEKRLR